MLVCIVAADAVVLKRKGMMTSSNGNCAGNSPVTGEFPAQRPMMQSFDVFFDLRLNKQLSKQTWGWWFEMLLSPLWCHSNARLFHKKCELFEWKYFDSLINSQNKNRTQPFKGWYIDYSNISLKFNKLLTLFSTISPIIQLTHPKYWNDTHCIVKPEIYYLCGIEFPKIAA